MRVGIWKPKNIWSLGANAQLTRLGDVINDWRVGSLGLERLASTVGPDILSILKVPYTYCWSPALVPKPADWPSNFGEQIRYNEAVWSYDK